MDSEKYKVKEDCVLFVNGVADLNQYGYKKDQIIDETNTNFNELNRQGLLEKIEGE